MFKPEKSPEIERGIETKIILEFMRHGEKEVNKEKKEEEIRLTEKGKGQAVARGKDLNPQVEVSLARGSEKKRAQETSAHAMLANEERIDPNASLEEMEEANSNELKLGKKIVEDRRLGYQYSPEMAVDAANAIKEKRYFPFIIQESDSLAIKRGDKISSTFTRYAGNIAELIYRYSKVGNNFNRIASKSDKYEKYGNQLERYLGNHMGSVESFVAKALEKTKGVEKRDEFVKSVGGGFKETEGIYVEILNEGAEQKIFVTYAVNNEKKTIEINTELLEEIIGERNEFEKKVLENAK